MGFHQTGEGTVNVTMTPTGVEHFGERQIRELADRERDHDADRR
jgi:hypothetical protein